MAVTTEQDMFVQAMQIAEQVGVDIKSDNPEIDTSYDLYVEKILRVWYAVIDMGEAYHAVYVWDPHFQKWEQSFEWDSYVMQDRILKQRGVIT